MDCVAFLPEIWAWLEQVARRAGVRGWCFAAALAMPVNAFSQIGEAATSEQQILARIESIESAEGSDSADLLAPLTTLSILLEERNQIGSAVTAVERARQIVRANFGPHSLKQAPFIRRLIDYEQARDNYQGAWVLEHDLLELAMRNNRDLASVPILHEIGDKRIEMATQLMAGDIRPEIYLGCYYDWARDHDPYATCYSGSRSAAVRAVLADAQRIYASAVAVMLVNEAYSSAELQQLETKILQSNYSVLDTASHRGPRAYSPYPLVVTRWQDRMAAVYQLATWGFPDSYFESPLEQASPLERDGGRGEWHKWGTQYEIGRLSLQRQLAYTIDTGAPLSEQAQALVQIADWDLLYGRNGLAIEGYALAFEKLDELDAEPAVIETLFSPPAPVVLPWFAEGPLAAARLPAASETGEYVAVRFELSRFGRSRNIEVLDVSSASPESANEAASELVRSIREARFRPQTRDGDFVHSTPVLVRYYLN